MITGFSISSSLRLLEKSQFWDREIIDNYQNARLRDLIKHAYSNVPFYNELFQDYRLKPEDIHTKADLIKLPIITKEDLKRNKAKHLAKNLRKNSLLSRSSSGSTAEPFQYYVTKDSESFLLASSIRAWNWMGYSLGDKYVKISMNPRTSILKKTQDWLNRCLYLSANQLSPTSFSEIAFKISEFNPKFLRCYPVPLLFLSEQIQDASKNYSGDSLIAINTTGSTLHDEHRAYIEKVFNVRIFDSYSCEGGTNFSQCDISRTYHPAEEYSISEFIFDDFSLSDPEKPLRHITTDLHNYASPFIRYDTQDYVVKDTMEKCDCGRNFINIKKIKGRDSDILVTPSRKFLIVENFVAYFEWIKEVEEIQVIQNKTNHIAIKVVVNNGYNKNLHEKILAYWQDYIGTDVEVVLEVVAKIIPTSAGKRRTVIRNADIPLNSNISQSRAFSR
jgi:phenylacetate-CoA ligase